MNPEEQIATLKRTVETREDQLARVMDELEEWKKLAQLLFDQLTEAHSRITKDRTDRINQLPPEYAGGIAKEP